MACHWSLQLNNSFYLSKSSGSKSKRKIKADAPSFSKLNGMELGVSFFSKNSISLGFVFARYTSRYVSLRVLSSMSSSASTGETNDVNEASATSFSQAVESLELAGRGAELAMAWKGKDVHVWHKRLAYQVAVYALLKTAIEVEILLSHDRHNPSPVKEIFTPKINLLGEYIENQLNMKHPELVQWFQVVELPHITGFFAPLLKQWSIEYAGSGIAGIIVAISCCAAVGKLGSERISCPLFTLSLEDVLIELMDLSHSIVEVDKLHKLATEVFPCNKTEELELWIGLAQQKLSLALGKEIDIRGTGTSCKRARADSLATLGLFAHLGRKTRLFLSRMGMKDLDELILDLLGYLECGCLFVYPELASVSTYQCFMEVVTDEIGWLDFYAACSFLNNQERERSKQHTIQAEKEIILSTIFTVCYDVFSGFAHFSRSAQLPLDADLLAFLLRSQNLLNVCLEDYWAVYDRSCEQLKIVEAGASDLMPPIGTKGTENIFLTLEAQQRPAGLILKGCLTAKSLQSINLSKASCSAQTEAITHVEASSTAATKPNLPHDSLLRKYSVKLVSTSSDLWMGTQLLVVDISFALNLLLKQLQGHKVTVRERKKLKRTLNDIITLIPVTILMLLPVSAVGHAAILAAIKKYMPFLIPSPYSAERLEVVKQLDRTKKMEVQSWSNLEDPSSRMP
ncbi:LETM1 and EF-hand domain-containing protein [Salix suchowensis]|nr:LETM1 and EF-hand domain-containing protein [Salix suchowensis]